MDKINLMPWVIITKTEDGGGNVQIRFQNVTKKISLKGF